MKYLLFFFISIASFSGNSQFRLKRVLNDFAEHPEPIDSYEYEKRIEKIWWQRKEKNAFLKSFCKDRALEKYNNLSRSLKETKGIPSLRKLQNNAEHLLDRWEERLNQQDTLFINEKYPFVITTIRGWYNRIQHTIDSLQRLTPSIPPKQEEEENSKQLEEKIEEILAKYSHPSRLKNISNEFSNEMNEMIDIGSDGKKPVYRLVFERTGPGHTDLVITIEPNFKKNQKYFARGEYDDPQINKVFEIFGIQMRNKLKDSIQAEAWVIGQADAYPLTKQNNSISYNKMSEIWGNISYTIHGGKTINLSPSESINNLELAFLRAWSAKYFFNRGLEQNCVTRIQAIDHALENPQNKDLKGTYRNATIKVFLINYFYTNYEELRDQKSLKGIKFQDTIIEKDMNNQ